MRIIVFRAQKKKTNQVGFTRNVLSPFPLQTRFRNIVSNGSRVNVYSDGIRSFRDLLKRKNLNTTTHGCTQHEEIFPNALRDTI